MSNDAKAPEFFTVSTAFDHEAFEAYVNQRIEAVVAERLRTVFADFAPTTDNVSHITNVSTTKRPVGRPPSKAIAASSTKTVAKTKVKSNKPPTVEMQGKISQLTAFVANHAEGIGAGEIRTALGFSKNQYSVVATKARELGYLKLHGERGDAKYTATAKGSALSALNGAATV